jgi:hypothetical protein
MDQHLVSEKRLDQINFRLPGPRANYQEQHARPKQRERDKPKSRIAAASAHKTQSPKDSKLKETPKFPRGFRRRHIWL